MRSLTDTQNKTQTQRRNIRYTVIAIVVLMLVFVGLFVHKVVQVKALSDEQLRSSGIILFEQARQPKAFTLTNQNGQPVSNSLLRDKISLLFFGFTHCPDICPTTLSELARVYQQLDAEVQRDIQIILVTVDPARDDPATLNAYLDYFNRDFVGLSGDFPQIMRLAESLNVAFHKVPQGESYTIDHTAHLAIINRHGDYAGFIKSPLPLNILARAISDRLWQLP